LKGSFGFPKINLEIGEIQMFELIKKGKKAVILKNWEGGKYAMAIS